MAPFPATLVSSNVMIALVMLGLGLAILQRATDPIWSHMPDVRWNHGHPGSA
jgi:hypothetical protein